MAWWGTALGGTVGALLAGPLGAVAGALVGRGMDRSMGRGPARPSLFGGAGPAGTRLKERFFESTFAVMGHLAKADGRVSEAEIALAQSVMERMGLSPALRRAAIIAFNQGKHPEFELDRALAELRAAGLGEGPLLLIFLEVQLAAAYLDGNPTPSQRAVLERIRRGLRVSASTYRRLERLILVQQQVLHGLGGLGAGGFRSRSTGQPTFSPQPDPLVVAYATLGVTPEASDAEVKRAYRLLMSRHHPDKLMSRGAPQEAMSMASQKTQEILRAYETISHARAA